MAFPLSPASLASRSARRPWLTLGAWGVAMLVAGVASVLWLMGALTSENRLWVTPESEMAANLIGERFFPSTGTTTEIVYVRSTVSTIAVDDAVLRGNDAAALTVDDPAFRAFVQRAHDAIMALGPDVVPSSATYYDTGRDGMVSLDRHSTGLVFTFVNDGTGANRNAYLAAVAGLSEEPGFEVFAAQASEAKAPEVLIVESAVHTADDPAFRTFVEGLLFDVLRLGPDIVRGAMTGYTTGDPSLFAVDRSAAIIPVNLDAWEDLPALLAVVERARQAADFDVWLTGAATIDNDFQELSDRDLKQGELAIGLPIAIFVLILVLGAAAAAAVPLLIAGVAIAVALGLVAVVGATTDLSIFVVNMVFMMGLAVGIDYGLFIIARFREERARGLDLEAAITRAGATAGKAVLFSGVTVVLALVGLLLVPTIVFFSLGLGAILVVIVAIAVSLTLLPAVLSLLGDRVNALRIPFVGRRVDRLDGGGLWERISRTVMKAPVVSLVLWAGVLVALALPTVQLQTGASGVSSFPDSFEARRGFEVLEAKFSSGLASPVNIAIEGSLTDPALRNAVDDLTRRIAADGAFGPVTQRIDDHETAIWLQTAITLGDVVSSEAVAAVTRLRADYIPAAFAGLEAPALVGGETAFNIDWFAVADDAAPLVISFVLGFSFVLLALVFRSVVIPLTAIVLNLLSVAAAYGAMVLVFHMGVGTEFLGFERAETIEAWIPVFLFSVLFGLSMDYHVFLLSRIRERYSETRDTRASVAFGVRSTGRLITGAALIMVAVFAGFASGNLIMFQQMGFGLAVAVLLDATIVRSVLVPASMSLLGRWNWYLPRFLGWLPHLDVEGSDPHPPVASTPSWAAASYRVTSLARARPTFGQR